MRSRLATVLVVCALIGFATSTVAQALRKDTIWARRSIKPIFLNGVLSESAWAKAESIVVQYGVDTGIPGSGWKPEAGIAAGDPTFATLKLLTHGNQLYLGAEVRDASVGGSLDFNRFDGFLMAIKDRMDPEARKPPAEYFYSWWYPDSVITDPQPPGQLPGFVGRWAEFPPRTPRTAEQIAAWDAVTVVHGISNDDTTGVDTGYTVEMRFNLTPMGYDIEQVDGDIVEWNISIYDCDWFWPVDLFNFSSNRVWWQSPWGNQAWYNEVRVFAKPFVTENTTPLPPLDPEFHVPDGSGHLAPTIDGQLLETVWTDAYTFDIRYGDDALRATYPGVARYRAGQFQPTIHDSILAFVADPADATVKMFFRGDNLYLGFDVRDQVVQHHALFDRWDGFIVMINDRTMVGLDNQLFSHRLSFQIDQDGSALPQDALTGFVVSGDAQVVVHLNVGTTVDTVGADVDNGYTAELEIDLTALGYPPGLGDRALFIGVNHLDGDSYPFPEDSYGTRTWWGREYESECCPIVGHLGDTPTDVGREETRTVLGYTLLGTYPNPGRQSKVRFAMARSSDVMLELFDVRGRRVEKRHLGVQPAGIRDVLLTGAGYSAGVYLYRLKLRDPETGILRTSLQGRVLVVK
jgi:hypothetical protein